MASSRFFVCWVPFCRTTVGVVLLGLVSASAFAKTAELSAIEVYPAADTQGYVQISGFTLNAKNEVHLCTGLQTINKNSYGKLPKITLGPGMSLERAKDGMLLLSRGGAPDYYKLTLLGFRLLHGDQEEPPTRRHFAEVGIAHH